MKLLKPVTLFSFLIHSICHLNKALCDISWNHQMSFPASPKMFCLKERAQHSFPDPQGQGHPAPRATLLPGPPLGAGWGFAVTDTAILDAEHRVELKPEANLAS